MPSLRTRGVILPLPQSLQKTHTTTIQFHCAENNFQDTSEMVIAAFLGTPAVSYTSRFARFGSTEDVVIQYTGSSVILCCVYDNY